MKNDLLTRHEHLLKICESESALKNLCSVLDFDIDTTYIIDEFTKLIYKFENGSDRYDIFTRIKIIDTLEIIVSKLFIESKNVELFRCYQSCGVPFIEIIKLYFLSIKRGVDKDALDEVFNIFNFKKYTYGLQILEIAEILDCFYQNDIDVFNEFLEYIIDTIKPDLNDCINLLCTKDDNRLFKKHIYSNKKFMKYFHNILSEHVFECV